MQGVMTIIYCVRAKLHKLQRFFTILEDLSIFLFIIDQTLANAHLSFLSDKENVTSTDFPIDIFKHINGLNLKLKNKEILMWELLTEVKCLYRRKRKLDLFNIDLTTSFGQYNTFHENLKSEFENRFAEPNIHKIKYKML